MVASDRELIPRTPEKKPIQTIGELRVQIWRKHIEDYLIAEQGCIDATYYALEVLERDKGNCVFGRSPEIVAERLNKHIERGRIDFTIRTKQKIAWIRGYLIGWKGDEVIYELRNVEFTNRQASLREQPLLKTEEHIRKRWDIFFWPKIIPHPDGRYAELLTNPPVCKQPKFHCAKCNCPELVERNWRSG